MVVLAAAGGSADALVAPADNHRHSGTLSVRVEFYGSNGKGAVTVLARGGRRVARHVVHQVGAERFVVSRFVLEPGDYTVTLRPRSGLWARCQAQVTAGVQARSTSQVWLGGPCGSY